jgi:hypothetical protein
MSTQPIGYSGYNYTSAQLQRTADEAESQKSGQIKKDQSENVSWKTQIRDQVNEYLSDIPKGTDGKLSFKDIEDYRKKLETEWDDSVKADLEKLGVNTETDFPLSYDPATGKLTVSNTHPDKAKIEQYFESNPDKVEEFQKIIQLGKMTYMSKSTLSPLEMQKNIQQEAMAWWYEDNSDPTSWFKGGGLMLGQGQSTYSGLNLKV